MVLLLLLFKQYLHEIINIWNSLDKFSGLLLDFKTWRAFFGFGVWRLTVMSQNFIHFKFFVDYSKLIDLLFIVSLRIFVVNPDVVCLIFSLGAYLLLHLPTSDGTSLDVWVVHKFVVQKSWFNSFLFLSLGNWSRKLLWTIILKVVKRAFFNCLLLINFFESWLFRFRKILLCLWFVGLLAWIFSWIFIIVRVIYRGDASRDFGCISHLYVFKHIFKNRE